MPRIIVKDYIAKNGASFYAEMKSQEKKDLTKAENVRKEMCDKKPIH